MRLISSNRMQITYIKNLCGYTDKFGIFYVVRFGHLLLIGFVESIGM